MEEMLDLGLREMRKILKMPSNGKKGANLPVIREKIKIVALIQNRMQGSVVQRVQSHNKSEHVHVHTKTQEAPKSLDEINKEIRSIERTVRGATDARLEKGLESHNETLETEQPILVDAVMAETPDTVDE